MCALPPEWWEGGLVDEDDYDFHGMRKPIWMNEQQGNIASPDDDVHELGDNAGREESAIDEGFGSEFDTASMFVGGQAAFDDLITCHKRAQ